MPYCALVYTDIPALSALLWMLYGILKRRPVVFCAAPVLRYGDALGLAREVDGVVLVGDERYPTRLALRSALKALHTVRAPVRGLVLNR